MRRWIVLAVVLPLVGCGHKAPEPVEAIVSGPRFPATAFECGGEPAPPDPGKVGNRAGSAAARYENALRRHGNLCRRKLGSVGAQLRAAGQVEP